MANKNYLTQNKSLMEKRKNKKDVRRTDNKEQIGRRKSYFIRNCIKGKWIKHSSRKAERLAE